MATATSTRFDSRFAFASIAAGIALLAAPAPARCAETAPLEMQSYEAPDAIVAPPISPTPPRDRTEHETRWYGYQIMIGDLVSASLLGWSKGNSAAIALGAGGIFLGPLIVHAAHRRPLQALLSPVMRIGLPILGATIGYGLAGCHSGEEWCGLGEGILGGLVGFMTGVSLDWFVLSRENASVESEASPRPASTSSLSMISAGVVPLLNGGASVAIGGRF